MIRSFLLIILESLLSPDKGFARTNYKRHVISFIQSLTAGSNSFLTHFTHNAFFLFPICLLYDVCLYFLKHFTPKCLLLFLNFVICLFDCYLLVDIVFPKSTIFLYPWCDTVCLIYKRIRKWHFLIEWVFFLLEYYFFISVFY